MEDDENVPKIISMKPLEPEHEQFQEIAISSDEFTIGRCLKNAIVIPCITISRYHCAFKKTVNNEWLIEDYSSFGIKINDEKLGRGSTKKLSHEDIIILEPNAFVYKFIHPNSDVFEIPRKRMKMESCILDNVKIKFDESQNYEIKHIEDKIQSTKQLQTSSIKLKRQLQIDMDRKIQQLESDYAQQIENLKGEKNEVEKQKALLTEERDELLAQVKNEMEGKIAELKEQIQKHNETESELLTENKLLKEKLTKERDEFLAELSRESSSKQDMLDKLEAKIREQEEVLKKETEQLRLTKEKELKELEELKKQRELELVQEVENIKKTLKEQLEQTEEQRLKAEEQLNLQMEQMKKLSEEDKIKMEQLLTERMAIQSQLAQAQENAESSLAELRKRVTDRETELAALAAQRIQQQVEQSSVVITTLQEQLEKVKNQLESVQTEKNTLLESICSENVGEGTSKQNTLTEVGELMENELQCSICAELFIEATTLNCSHTFCKYCITMWKKKKKDCPICRSSITSENRSLALDTFIEKMVQNLTEEMKVKRQDLLKYRAELVSEMARQTAGTSRRSFLFDESEISDEEFDEEFLEEEEDEYESQRFDYSFYRRRYYDTDTTYSDSGSYVDADSDQSSGATADLAAAGDGGNAAVAGAASGVASTAASDLPLPTGSGSGGGRRRRGHVDGVPGSYYGGYGRCFSCGARGHWAPGCPFR